MYSNRVRRSSSPLLIRCPGRPSPSAVTRSSLRVASHRVPSTTTQCGIHTTALAGSQTPARRQSKPRTAYKHIPHRDKPPHLVARRNARERRRVQAVNSAFLRLRRHLPHPVVGKHKRLSKVYTDVYCAHATLYSGKFFPYFFFLSFFSSFASISPFTLKFISVVG